MAATIRGRERELAALRASLARGGGAALVVLGEYGMGKSTLLDVARAAEVRVLETAGVAAEATLPLAGLHRLLQPLRDRVAELAGIGDPFAFHRLLVEAAAGGPLLCLADDVHLMDRSRCGR